MNILIIEDNPGDVRLVQEMLKETRGDFSIIAADRLATALQFLGTHALDIVLLDLNLPDSSGLETLTRLKAGFPHLPIIVTTSVDDEALAVRAVREGAADYLVKGQVEGRLLRHTILYSIERKRMELALAAARDELEKRVRERTADLMLAEEEMRALSNRLLAVQEDERRAIACELHDQVGQCLTMIKLLLERALKASPEKVAPLLTEASRQATEVIGQVRNISLGLRPSMLDDLGLVPTLVWLIERVQTQSGLKVEFAHGDMGTFPPQVNTAAYRIVQEALTNIVRHARASCVKIRLWVDNGTLLLSIEDNGCGFDVRALTIGTSTGLSGMRERAKLLGGRFRLDSTTGSGTRIIAELPLSPAADAGDTSLAGG